MIANCTLCQIIRDNQDHYARMLTLIMAGASVPSTALLIGICRRDLEYYRIKGLADLAQNVDSYYARFVNDVNFAATVPSIDAEVAIHRKDPLEWLRSGPGRWINPEGTWQQPSKEPPALTEVPATVGIAEASRDDVEEEVDLMQDAPTQQDLPAALLVLKQSGLGHVIDEAESELARRQKVEAMEDNDQDVHDQDEGRREDHSETEERPLDDADYGDDEG